MKFKITGDIDISGKTKGDTIEAEEHAMEVYIKNGTVEAVKKAVKKKK